METSTKNTLIKGGVFILFTILLLGSIGYGIKWGLDYWKGKGKHSVSSPITIEQIAELATLSYEFDQYYCMTDTTFGSKKALVIKQKYKAKLGIRGKDGNFDSIEVRLEENNIDVSGYETIMISCTPVDEPVIAVDIGGLWNWMTNKDRDEAYATINREAQKYVNDSESLRSMAETNFRNMLLVRTSKSQLTISKG